MKTLLIVATSLSLLGAAAAQAQPQDHNDNRNNGGYGHDQGRQAIPAPVSARGAYHESANGKVHYDNGRHNGWARGQRLPKEYRSGSYVVTDWRARHLRQPARGYRWVRVDNNYVLASVATGLIANVLAGR
ncbi:MAG TPA: RcnB family protein [Caulobacteraceae bacterium]|jgi:Ni/Co efflux regulator RcnB|nr:RcnB family protein [Caulobacteraceae bacterium]